MCDYPLNTPLFPAAHTSVPAAQTSVPAAHTSVPAAHTISTPAFFSYQNFRRNLFLDMHPAVYSEMYSCARMTIMNQSMHLPTTIFMGLIWWSASSNFTRYQQCISSGITQEQVLEEKVVTNGWPEYTVFLVLVLVSDFFRSVYLMRTRAVACGTCCCMTSLSFAFNALLLIKDGIVASLIRLDQEEAQQIPMTTEDICKDRYGAGQWMAGYARFMTMVNAISLILLCSLDRSYIHARYGEPDYVNGRYEQSERDNDRLVLPYGAVHDTENDISPQV